MEAEIKNEAADLIDKLSIERTKLALERTHLAWIRTIILLITSGFAIDSIAEAYHEGRIEAGKAFHNQPHVISIGMVFTSMLLLIFESIIYIKRTAELNAVLKYPQWKIFANGLILTGIIFCVNLLLIFYMLTN
jgi:uncharacterized membrane protein YidH (DUF202 family)